MAYAILALAIGAEVAATLSLRASDGFSKPGYVAIVIIGYVIAIVLLSMALSRGLQLAIAYAVWAATGVSAVALLSVVLYGESLSAVQAGGIVLVALGVFVIEAGGAH